MTDRRRVIFTNLPAEESSGFAEAAVAAHRDRIKMLAEKWGQPVACILNELANLLNLSRLLATQMGQRDAGLLIGGCITEISERVIELRPDINAQEFQDAVLHMAHSMSYERSDDQKPN